jgi:hypothetical protein
MKRNILCFIVFIYGAFFAFAQTTNTNIPRPLGINDKELNDLINAYLTRTFSRHLQRGDFRITELSCVPDWVISNDTLVHYDVQGNFRNFAIINRILYGRLETKIAVRRQTGQNRRPGIEDGDNTGINITLLVDDNLSDELRDAMVRNYLMRNYDNPLGIDIKNEHLEVYPDRIYSYVSSVVNNESIIYLRAIFENWPPVEQQVNIFYIKESPWQLNRAEVLSSKKFPADDTFKADIHNGIFGPIRGHYLRENPGKGNPNENLSKVESITKTDLLDANVGTIKLKFDLEYLLDWWGFIGSYKRYNVIVNAFYQFNFEEEKWVFQGIEDIKPENITARSK